MHLNFDTDDLRRAKAALLLYAMYRSRDKASPLNGLETWDRFAACVRGACLKSYTTAGFVEAFCHKAKIASVRPRYLSTGEPVKMPDSGNLIMSDGVRDYRLGVMEDNSLLPLYAEESQYLIMLVRERIQREKMEGAEDEEAD